MPTEVMVLVVVRAVAVVLKTPMLIVAALGDMAADVMTRMLALVMALHAWFVEHPEVAALDRLVATLRRAVALAVLALRAMTIIRGDQRRCGEHQRQSQK